jgi:hypothetical protein
MRGTEMVPFAAHTVRMGMTGIIKSARENQEYFIKLGSQVSEPRILLHAAADTQEPAYHHRIPRNMSNAETRTYHNKSLS